MRAAAFAGSRSSLETGLYFVVVLPRSTCSRQGHRLKRTTVRDLGRPDTYLASWNSNRSVLNVVEETFLTQEAWDASPTFLLQTPQVCSGYKQLSL
jgi:hypothetical protein